MYDSFQTEYNSLQFFFLCVSLLSEFKFLSYHPSARIFTERAAGYYCSF